MINETKNFIFDANNGSGCQMNWDQILFKRKVRQEIAFDSGLNIYFPRFDLFCPKFRFGHFSLKTPKGLGVMLLLGISLKRKM